MSQRQTECPTHGREGVGLVCEHIAFALAQGKRVGFFWADQTDTARPDAWCSKCEESYAGVRSGADAAKWFDEGRFKVFCAKCWDEAKRVCGGFTS